MLSAAAEAEETAMSVFVSPRLRSAATVSSIQASGAVPSIEVATPDKYSSETPLIVAEISVVSVDPAGTVRSTLRSEVAIWNFLARSKITAVLTVRDANLLLSARERILMINRVKIDLETVVFADRVVVGGAAVVVVEVVEVLVVVDDVDVDVEVAVVVVVVVVGGGGRADEV